MKKLKIFICICVVIFGIVLCCLWLCPFSLEKTANRSYPEYPLSKELKEQIRNASSTYYELSAIELSLDITGSLLEFSEKNDIKNGKANCVGYAQLFTSICNNMLKVNGRKERVRPVVGNIKWCGINLCEVLKAIVPKKYESFVKDHDFIELEYEDKYVYVDPTLFDYCIRTGWTECPKK